MKNFIFRAVSHGAWKKVLQSKKNNGCVCNNVIYIFFWDLKAKFSVVDDY